MEFHELSPAFQKVLKAFKQHLPIGEDLKKKVLYEIGRNNRRDRPRREDVYDEYMAPILAALGDDAHTLLADFLTNPADHNIPWNREDDTYHTLNTIASVLAGVHVERHPTEYAAKLLMQRLQKILQDPLNACEIEESWQYTARNYAQRYYFPKPNICFRILSKYWHLDNVKTFFNAVYQGDYNQKLDFSEGDYEEIVDSCYELMGYETDMFDRFLQLLFEADELSYAWFAKAAQHYPYYLNIYRALIAPYDEDEDDYEKDNLSPEYKATYKQYTMRLIREQVAGLPETAGYAYQILRHEEFRGIEWIKAGLEQLEVADLKAKDLKDDYSEGLAEVIKSLIGIVGLAQDETDDELIAALKAFKEPILLLALPYANYARNAILKALGWDDIVPLQRLIFNIAGGSPDTSNSLSDVYNCENPESGVVDRATAKDILENADSKRATKYLKVLKASSLSVNNTLMLINAVMGKDRESIEKKLAKHGQAAIKAYGLYEVESDEELRDRYLRFKAMHKEATKYGSERQLNTQAAVKAGLKNLSQAAGFTDEIRMEWALEADIATNMTPLDTPFEVEDWTIQLVMEGITPRIEVSKQDKPLKSVPPKVRQSSVYKEMRTTQDTIRGQASRFRKTLEDMMCNNEVIPAEELLTLSRLPVVRAMLSQLIMQTSTGAFGLFNGSTDSLDGLEGDVPISGELRIAHVYHLFQANVLSQWQKSIVRRRIVQPFKQAFRELYIVTPAEIDAGCKSRRFVGHVIDTAITSRLLQSRGWNQLSGDVVEVFKRFPSHKLYAEIGFPEARHFLAEDDTATMDEIWFARGHDDVPLKDVDPMIFSEVMRDADLVASVAQVDDDDVRWSTETALRRTELITTLISEIGLKQVRCEDHFAYIDGKLANYRIHLGSGVIHIQPGNYLCIIPDPQEKNKKETNLYLPFADTDRRMAEIVSKIFLLMNDDRIKDQSILSQITASTG